MLCFLLIATGIFAGQQTAACDKDQAVKYHEEAKCHAGQASCHPCCRHQPIVIDLITILDSNSRLKDAVKRSLKVANRAAAPTLHAYYRYLDDMVTMIPTDRNLYAHIVEFYYLVDHDSLLKDCHALKGPAERQDCDLFQQWAHRFAFEWGDFLDTPESAAGIQTFLTDADFHMDDYFEEPSGWTTFNQFFAREVKPGKRPVEELCDDSVIVAPADTTFVGCWEICEDSSIWVKDKGSFSVMELLDAADENGDSPYKDKFAGGTFMHAFLNVNDYHRYHVPVAGQVEEVKIINGYVVLNTQMNSDGSISADDDTGYQFAQQRGLIMQQSSFGLVATLPIGMAHVSSVNIAAEEGSYLHKGEEFGFFLFGGSDIIVMFDNETEVTICAEKDVHYNQGEAIAYTGSECRKEGQMPFKCEPCP
jgi:phosphatidylserine decarboxylase precursor